MTVSTPLSSLERDITMLLNSKSDKKMDQTLNQLTEQRTKGK